MKATLLEIQEKPSDFKICLQCDTINNHENDVCHKCFVEDFDERGIKAVKNKIGLEYEFYESLGYKEDDINNINIEV